MSSFDPAKISATQWRQIVNSAADTAIITLDPNGLVTSWNEGARRIFGWEEAEMLGQPLDRLFPPEEHDQIYREIQDAREHGRGGAEGWRFRSDGKRIWAVGELSPIWEGAQLAGFVKVLRDRSAQREAEETIHEERRALELLNRAGSALAVETDLKKLVQLVTDIGVELCGAEFGAFFYNLLNDAGESYMLYTLSGVPAEAFAKFPMPRNTDVFAQTFSGEGILRSDDITKDPRYGRNAPNKGMPPGHLPVRSYLAVPVVSKTSGVIGGLFFGHQKSGIFTAHSERGLAGLAAEAAVAIDNARLTQAMQKEIDERLRAEQSLQALNSDLEKQVAARTAELRKNEEALRQAQKMEAVGQLTGGIAHDFNNILQIISGNLETIKRRLTRDDERIQLNIERAMIGTQRAASLTQRLLAFSRRSPLNPKPIEPRVLINGMSDLLTRTLGETIAVEAVNGAGLWRIEADRTELESAILNLALNARDAMPNGGKLTIEATNVYIDERYASEHVDVRAGEYVVISVSDTGVGMEPATLAQAFEPFFTTKPVGEGTGLGLSQVYGFVKQSGGHIKIYSELGHGTTVRIYLPRLANDVTAEPDISEAVTPGAGNKELILVVEDDQDVRANSVEILKELGYAVIEAEDGPSAIRLLQRHTHISLLFTDVVLPNGMTGADIATQARAIQPGIRILFTTGYARNAIFHHGRLDKGVQLLTKPFTFNDLASKVRTILDDQESEGGASPDDASGK